MPKSTATAARGKANQRPQKPRPDFPLFPHATGRWAKKVRGKLEYFGKVTDDPQGAAALIRWLEDRDDLLAGRRPRRGREGLTVEDLADHFLNAKKRVIATGELSQRTYADYFSTCERILNSFGKTLLVEDLRPDDFDKLRSEIGRTRGAVALGNEVRRVRSVFRFGVEQGLITTPVRFGQGFKKPNRKSIRKARAAGGSRMLEASEIRAVLAAADVQMKAMVLLAANGALGQSDIAGMPITAVDLKGGWLNYPRPKTGINRRIPLWKKTVTAVKAAIKSRPEPHGPEEEGLLFLTYFGRAWVKLNKKGTPSDALGHEFADLLERLKIKRPGVSFYALRHSWRTVADETRDFPAIDLIMGHADHSMAAAYRERISDDRLRAVVDHVHAWLFAVKAK